MEKEKIMNTKPENLTGEECTIFDSDPIFKKEYEKKWDTEVDCVD